MSWLHQLRTLHLLAIWFGGIALLVPVAFYAGILLRFTPPDQLIDENGAGVQVLDRNGQLLFEFAGPRGEIRTPVPLGQVSPHLINATVATEDDNFWQNSGLNLRGLLRAAYENVAFWKHGGFLKGPGGSSITQQLAKNLYIPEDERGERSLDRKLRETVLAFELDRRYSKQQILVWYLNCVFYGNTAWGVEAASRRYFDKHASELTLAEAAMLAGIPAAPALFDPLHNPMDAKQRQQQVLDLMVRQGYLSPEQAKAAAAEQLTFRAGAFPINAPHFVMYVHNLLPELIGDRASQGGLRVTTTLDLSLQQKAEEAVQRRRQELQDKFQAGNAGLVAIKPQTGEILAMAGSADYFDDDINGQVNNVTALNRPGSTLKPIVYLAAIMKGWSPATIIEDRPIPLTDGSKSFILANPDGKYREQVSLRRALGNSLNPPAVRALEFAGEEDSEKLARRMGLTTVDENGGYGSSFALGGLDVSLLDLTYAYSVLADQGQQAGMPTILDLPDDSRPLDPVAVLRVEDLKGKVLWEPDRDKKPVAPPRESYLITTVLADNAARAEVFGTESALQLDRPAAVKTGLSDDNKDAWAVGYTPDLVAGVWVGNTNDAPMKAGVTSAATAAPIWHDFMTAALQGQPPNDFPPPDGISFVKVCASTGLLPTPRCHNVATEPFLSELTPKGVGNPVVEAQATPQPAAVAPSRSCYVINALVVG